VGRNERCSEIRVSDNMAYLTPDKRHVPCTWRVFLFILANPKFYTADLMKVGGSMNSVQNYLHELSLINVVKKGRLVQVGLGYLWTVDKDELNKLISFFRMEVKRE